ncbi:murein DD-endopeptidase MepM/ murein hydrolase activator NlpD [Friedmanniella endophytica]|uniref:Murein DD-endopeptidase MepM/ murein hydrolase activator NlpD n=1 Tax=Microlunatus kandeliicorticis TaxID=1759536 RepID=A0A7W3IR23_9ACTN|nr:M23 family metallopeptidase [Microlunatus kandeliicorticis]MBA8793672.1 murein DD-endopeptidase MepM/ murein hydrolase activator NlpD [Microlunatus kandeliicorticis]
MDPATAKMALQLATTLARQRGFRYLIVGLVLAGLCTSLAVVFGPWMLAAQLTASLRGQQQRITDGGSCADSTLALAGDAQASGDFSAEQVRNATTIWSVSQQLSLGDRGAVVGIATALQESGLRNLNYGDRDSLGLFQQRASWGPAAVREDPVHSSRLFFQALAKVTGWQLMSVTVAAQTVQRSAFPDAYAKWERSAAGLVASIKAKAPAGSADAVAAMGSGMCGAAGAMSCPATGMAAEQGLTPDALRVFRCLKDSWPQLTTLYGVGDRPANVDTDHQDGRAVDAMIPGPSSATGVRLGDAIAAWAVRKHQALGVKYVIWNARIWNVERASEGWRSCGTSAAACYSGPDPTAAHRDHVHISVYGDQAGSGGASGVRGFGSIVLPVDHYVLTARFGQCSSHWANCHTGLDFAAPTGTPIHAIMAGTVVWAGWGGAYGNLTKIQHPNGVQSWYAHQSAQEVRVGDAVSAGQVIGRIGATGNTTGPHLHLEVRVNGTPVDPDAWLSGRGVSP